MGAAITCEIGHWLIRLGQTSLEVSVLIVLILVVQIALGQRLSARWRYALMVFGLYPDSGPMGALLRTEYAALDQTGFRSIGLGPD